MENILTAREILENNHINEGFELEDQCTYDISVDSMIEFAKLHVEAALKAASENADVYPNKTHTNGHPMINKDSILNSYPLENIK